MSKLQTKKILLGNEVMWEILRCYGIADFTYEAFTQGIANTTMRVVAGDDQYVLRIYALDRKTDSQILFELNFQEYLRQNGIPTPRVQANLKGERLTIVMSAGWRWQVVLFEYIKGKSRTKRHTVQLIRELGSLQARMHVLGGQFSARADAKHIKVLRDYYACNLTETSRYSVNIQQFVAKAKQFRYELDPALPCSYNHLDLDLDGNVIVEGGHIQGVIDFDDLAYSPTVVCLGYSLWNVLHDAGDSRMRQYLNWYQRIRPISKAEKQVLSSVVRFRNYEIGALRLFRTKQPTCMERPLEIEEIIAEGSIFT